MNRTFTKKLLSSENVDISSLFLLFRSKQRTKQFIPVEGEERNKLSVQMTRITEAGEVADIGKEPGGPPPSPLVLGKKEMTKGKKASRGVNQDRPSPPSSRSGSTTAVCIIYIQVNVCGFIL